MVILVVRKEREGGEREIESSSGGQIEGEGERKKGEREAGN